MRELFGNVPGGLAIVTIFSSMFFAALCGSGPATAGAVGSVMIPAMNEMKYPKKFAGGVVATGGTLGILIPPSNPMIVYGVITNVSIAGLFMAGVLPGIILGMSLVLYCFITGKINGYVATGQKFSIRRLLWSIYQGKFALFMPFLVLGSIYGGFVTPTEASIVAVLYAIFLGGFVYKELSFKIVTECFRDTAQLCGSAMVIMGPAMAFGKILAMCNIPDRVGNFILDISNQPIVVLLLIALLLLFVESFMETLTSIIILTPVFLPTLIEIGVSPIHFGVLFVVLSEVGFLTPPVGANLYITSAISGLSLEEITQGVVPFIILMIVVIILLIVFPELCTVGYYLVSKG
jgi:C4-dicarboxylate transporter DctM subunit